MAESLPWGGIFPSIPTAFASDGGLDLAAQRRMTRFAVDKGAHGLLCFGLAGEVLRLTPAERCALCDVILEEVNGQVPVLVGASAESEFTACQLAAYAERAGASGIVLPIPTGGLISEELLLRYFAGVAGS